MNRPGLLSWNTPILGSEMAPLKEFIEEVEFLARSPARVRILEALQEGGTVGKDELSRKLNVSRTTQMRNHRALESHGWIEETSQGYRLSPCGSYVAEELLDLVDTVTAAKRLQPVLQWLDPDDVDLDLSALSDAKITLSTATNPYAPVEAHVDKLRSATFARALLPEVGRAAAEASLERVRSSGSQFEAILTERVANRVTTDSRFTDVVEAARNLDRYDIYVTTATVPYYLGIVDETVQLGVSDDNHLPRALLEISSDSVREWADEQYSTYRTRATPLQDAAVA